MPNRPHLFQRFNSDHQLLKSSPKSPAKKQQPAKVAPKSASNNQILANLFGATSFTTSSCGKKMRHVEMIMEDQQLETGGSGQQQTQQQQQQQESTLQTSMKRPKSGPAKKWASAFRVVHAMTRFKNMPKRHHHEGLGGSRGSSFSGSNESTPTRGTHQQDQEPEIIDPVYLALKQATAKYGNSAGNGSRSGSRRGSQVALAGHGHLFDADTTPSPRNLSQTSLQDSGYSGGCVEIGGSRSRLVSGSTPHLHRAGVGLANGKTTTTSAGGGGGGATTSSQQPAGTATNTGSGQQQQQSGGGRRPKLSEKMKSLSLDCAEMPAPVQPSLGRNQYYKSKPIRSARGFATSGESFEDALERSVSPPASARTVSMAAAIPPMVQPRRLPPAPTPQQQPQTAAQQPTGAAPPSAAASTMPVGTHIVIHEYIYGDCTLYLGDRLVVVDNGDPDWKHGFKVNDRLEQLYTFPSTCVSGFQPNEQPMKLIQNCNLTEQKLRLYRDQVIFVQPNSLREDGRVLIRNEHGTFAYCPLHFLQLM